VEWGLIYRSGRRKVSGIFPLASFPEVSDSAGGEEEFEKEAYGGEIRSWQ
jgi:hypothetical protein